MDKEIDVKTESYSLVDHNPTWKQQFQDEKRYLQSILPPSIIGRIAHIGSTAIIGIKAKPIIDMLMEVSSQEIARAKIAPILEKKGYQHIVFEGLKDDEPPQSSRFIKRDKEGQRTHHIRCAEKGTSIWHRVLFVRYLNEHLGVAKEYEALKMSLLEKFPTERRKYLDGKTEFIEKYTELAIRKYIEK